MSIWEFASTWKQKTTFNNKYWIEKKKGEQSLSTYVTKMISYFGKAWLEYILVKIQVGLAAETTQVAQ